MHKTEKAPLKSEAKKDIPVSSLTKNESALSESNADNSKSMH
jgi:hypothetical protein